MASQQVLFTETIMAMKKAKKRKAYESDDDSEIENAGNRGQKLKRRSRFVHEGQLAPPSGPEFYREVVDHAGYQRAIIGRKPPLLDDEGYEIDSDDDEDDEHVREIIASAAQFDPYATIHLESILAPLTAVTDLAGHPTLSRPYNSEILTDLTKQGRDIMHKENAALWKVKHLHTKLIGDHIWAPCELMVGPNDLDFYRDDFIDQESPNTKGSAKSDASILLIEAHKSDVPPITGSSNPEGGAATSSDRNGTGPEAQARDREDETANADADADTNKLNGSSQNKHKQEKAAPSENPRAQNGDQHMTGTDGPEGSEAIADGAKQQKTELEGRSSRLMSMTPDSSEELSIHPLFLPPRSAIPDRDMGIPQDEAEDMRRLMQLYVQKQEEVCRGAKRLYEGLLRAERMRKTVLQWSKHEAHVGPMCDMSDGEDWYDKEEWDLEDDLKKGQDEEEEESAQAQPAKKTRARR